MPALGVAHGNVETTSCSQDETLSVRGLDLLPLKGPCTDMAVSVDSGHFCGCPFNKCPTIWGL